jgi:RNA polymerase subunit RPABC4/transcription elongation factor Spt4
MAQITDAIGTFFGGVFSSPIVQLGLKAAGVYIVLLWLASAFWAYQDLRQRTANPIAPYLAAALIICFTPILFIFGVLLYRLVRPNETVAEANERALAEEAMLVEVESQAHCANCGRSVQPGWIICPSCRNRLRRVCPDCGKLVELDWSLCAWCGRDFERPEEAARARPAPASGGRIHDGAGLAPRRVPALTGSTAPPVPAAPAVAEAPTGVVSAIGRPLDREGQPARTAEPRTEGPSAQAPQPR